VDGDARGTRRGVAQRVAFSLCLKIYKGTPELACDQAVAWLHWCYLGPTLPFTPQVFSTTNPFMRQSPKASPLRKPPSWLLLRPSKQVLRRTEEKNEGRTVTHERRRLTDRHLAIGEERSVMLSGGPCRRAPAPPCACTRSACLLSGAVHRVSQGMSLLHRVPRPKLT